MISRVFVFFLVLNLFQVSLRDKWQELAPGLEIRHITPKEKGIADDSGITVIRIDPHRWELVFTGISLTGEDYGKSAREWCRDHNLTAAINAGMFAMDYKTHTGYLRYRDHVNSSTVNSYKSVMAFDRREESQTAPFRIYDLDEPGVSVQSVLKDYRSAIQNLRLIKKPGVNVWQQQERKWSEAAIGEDREGRILFIFSQAPFSMHDFNRHLLQSGIGIVAAQHLEGGPEAQLYLKAGNTEIEMYGSFETGFNEDYNNIKAWPVPNVLGIRPAKGVVPVVSNR